MTLTEIEGRLILMFALFGFVWFIASIALVVQTLRSLKRRPQRIHLKALRVHETHQGNFDRYTETGVITYGSLDEAIEAIIDDAVVQRLAVVRSAEFDRMLVSPATPATQPIERRAALTEAYGIPVQNGDTIEHPEAPFTITWGD